MRYIAWMVILGSHHIEQISSRYFDLRCLGLGVKSYMGRLSIIPLGHNPPHTRTQPITKSGEKHINAAEGA